MSSPMAKALLLLSASFFIVLSEAVVPQPPPPQTPPTHQTFPVRQYFAVQGEVYCRPCQSKSNGNRSSGATVELQCNRTELDAAVKITNTTDHYGHFKLQPKYATTYGIRQNCKVFFLSTASDSACKTITNINHGREGATLDLKQTTNLYTVGPFVSEPKGCE